MIYKKEEIFKLILKLSILIILTLYIKYYILNTNLVRAQTLSLGIEPPLLQVVAQPGKIITQAYKITNPGDQVVLVSKLLPFKPADAYGHIQLPENLTAPAYEYPFLNWFSLQNADLDLGDSFLLKTGEHQQLVLKIRIPENAAQGDYYTTLLIQSQPAADLTNSGSAQAGMIGTNILLTVSDVEHPEIDAEVDVEIQNPLFLFIQNLLKFFNLHWQIPKFLKNLKLVDSLDQIPFVITSKNKGDFRYISNGKLVVNGDPGIGFFEQELVPENVLAQSQRQQTIVWRKHGFLLGKFSAQVDLQPNPNTKISHQIVFVALPYKIITIIILAGGFGLWLKKNVKTRS